MEGSTQDWGSLIVLSVGKNLGHSVSRRPLLLRDRFGVRDPPSEARAFLASLDRKIDKENNLRSKK